jgi:hypothetical protein
MLVSSCFLFKAPHPVIIKELGYAEGKTACYATIRCKKDAIITLYLASCNDPRTPLIKPCPLGLPARKFRHIESCPDRFPPPYWRQRRNEHTTNTNTRSCTKRSTTWAAACTLSAVDTYGSNTAYFYWSCSPILDYHFLHVEEK